MYKKQHYYLLITKFIFPLPYVSEEKYVDSSQSIDTAGNPPELIIPQGFVLLDDFVPSGLFVLAMFITHVSAFVIKQLKFN